MSVTEASRAAMTNRLLNMALRTNGYLLVAAMVALPVVSFYGLNEYHTDNRVLQHSRAIVSQGNRENDASAPMFHDLLEAYEGTVASAARTVKAFLVFLFTSALVSGVTLVQ